VKTSRQAITILTSIESETGGNRMIPLALNLLAAGISTIVLFAAIPIIAAFVFWIVELVDAARRQFDDPNMKIVWILVIFFFHFIGALIYYFAGKKQGQLVV
jgi:hypothetical protein